MSQIVSLGAQDFAYIRENDCFFVDKTDFIREWWENKDAVTLIIRPRRFGKTLNLSMIQRYFEKTEKINAYLFDGLKISQTEAFYQANQGQFPVISLSLNRIGKAVTVDQIF